MNEIAFAPPQPRPVGIKRRSVVFGSVVLALAAAHAAGVPQIDVSRKCRGGAFSAGFSNGFDVGTCDLVVRTIGSSAEVVRIPLPRWVGQHLQP
jgi:hypothetical protein